MPLEPSRAQYQRIADDLRAAIERGDYAPGTELTPENALAERYGVNRHTVNRAVMILRADGLVRIERGKGAIIRSLPVLQREAIERQRNRERGGARGAFAAELEAQGHRHRVDTETGELAPPADVAGLLGIDPGSPALFRQRRMFADDVPVQLATSWLPLDIAAGTQLSEADTGPGGVYSRLDDLGHGPGSYTERVRVRLPLPDEAMALRLDAEQRVYAILRTAADSSGRVVEVNDMVLPAHQWELIYRWSAK